jgi:NAD(P)-dependent dehydrogenase (short-subunit alcohol dehydrogenase family)
MALSNEQPAIRLRDQDLADKVAVITGASRGIGRAIALNLASRGCCILATCSSPESLRHIDTLSHSIDSIYKKSPHESSKPKIHGIAANLLDSSTPGKIADALQRHFVGHLDILVNNACHASAMGIGELTDEHIHDNLMANIEIPVKIVEECVKRKLFRPASRIICISSVRARKGWSQQYVFFTFRLRRSIE